MYDSTLGASILGIPSGEPSILEYLAQEGAVLTGSHFVFTSGNHGTAYINMRAVAHDAQWIDQTIAGHLSIAVNEYRPDVILGPETLGRNLAQSVGAWKGLPAIWCDIGEIDGIKQASFSPKLDFGRLVQGMRVAIVDDLLTTGSSIKLVSQLVTDAGGEVVVAAVVVRRSPDVTAESCNVPALEVLAEVSGFEVFTPAQCAEYGPCSMEVPVVLRPGHGHAWIKDHPGYPVAV